VKNNPMHYCLECGIWLGHRGFCSEICHNRWYDKTPRVDTPFRKQVVSGEESK